MYGFLVQPTKVNNWFVDRSVYSSITNKLLPCYTISCSGGFLICVGKRVTHIKILKPDLNHFRSELDWVLLYRCTMCKTHALIFTAVLVFVYIVLYRWTHWIFSNLGIYFYDDGTAEKKCRRDIFPQHKLKVF